MSSVSLASWIFAGDPALDERFWRPVGGGPSASGVEVTPDTAMRVSAVYRCVALLANAFPILPFHVQRKLTRGRQDIPDHDAVTMFARRPNPYQTPFVFKRMMMGHLVLRGNCFAQIFDGAQGKELWPLHPDRVSGPELLENGRLRYKYRRQDGQELILFGNRTILHLTGLSSDGLRGLALSDLARETIGLALGAETRAGQMMKNGVRFSGTLKIPGTMGDPAKAALSSQFRNIGANEVPILESGMEFQQIGMTLEDAQFIEQRKFEISDIARWFGIPPHMIGDVERTTSWGTGIEHQSIQFVTYGLLPWVKLWEESINAAFIVERDVYSRFNVAGLLRSDTETRFSIYEKAIDNGIYSPNECREFEDENPREGGDVYVDPAKAANRVPDAPVEVDPEPEPDDDDEDAEAKARALMSARAQATSRAGVLLSEEMSELAKLAREHARDKAVWPSAVASFYGQFAGRVAAALVCSKKAAKGWCETRRGMILTQGLARLTDTEQGEAVAALTELALSNGAH